MPARRPRAGGVLAPFREPGPVGERERLRHVGEEIAAVDIDAGGGAIGELRARDEIAPPQLDAIDAEPLGRDVEQPLDDEGRLRPAGAAIGRGRRAVGHDAAHAHMRRRDVIDAGDDAGRVRQRHIGDRQAADVEKNIGFERADAAGFVERDARLGQRVAALIVGEKGFGAVAGPAHRPPDAARGPGHHDLLGVDVRARPEAAADIGADDMDALERHIQRGGQIFALAHRALAAGDHQVGIGFRVVAADRCARLHLRVDDALAAELVLDHDLGGGEGALGRGAVAELAFDGDIVPRRFPQKRRAGRDGVADIGDGGQGFVIDCLSFRLRRARQGSFRRSRRRPLRPCDARALWPAESAARREWDVQAC